MRPQREDCPQVLLCDQSGSAHHLAELGCHPPFGRLDSALNRFVVQVTDAQTLAGETAEPGASVLVEWPDLIGGVGAQRAHAPRCPPGCL
jgi:hypothetical protein